MTAYNPSSIRNVILAGHSGSGKTTLAEAMLFESGMIGRRGSILEKSTVSDFHAIEKEKQKSLFTSLLHLDWRGVKINLLDTPGTPDFYGEVVGSLPVADTALFVINAETGVEVATSALWDEGKRLGLPALIAVNRLDAPRSDFQRSIDMLKELAGRSVVVVQYPYSEGEDFHAIIDVLKMTMYEFPEGGGRPDKLPIPESHKAQAELLQNQLIEAIAENDETLMDLYFEQGTLDEYQMREGLQSTILQRQLFPVFCTSAINNMGSGRIMGFISNNLPSPLEASFLESDQGEPIRMDPDGSDGVYCFRTWTEEHVGQLSAMKVMSGRIHQGVDLENRRDGRSVRLGPLAVCIGSERREMTQVPAGDLCVALKLKDVAAGDTLAADGFRYRVQQPPVLEPVIRKGLNLAGEGNEDRLGIALAQIRMGDPALQVEHNQELRQVILHGMGEEHLAVVLQRLRDEHRLDVEFAPARIPWRETITRSSRAQYKHKKQSGGAGQFAEVHLLLEPLKAQMPEPGDLTVRDEEEIDLAWGGKLVFRNCIVGGVIDNRFMPAILKGVMEKMENGPMCGCPARDIRVSVFDGSMHPVDSNEAAFKTAARMAFREGFLTASPRLLEPVYEVHVQVPSLYMGDVLSDLSSRRGQILGMDSDGSIQMANAHVPLAELDTYASRLKSITQGSASLSRSFHHYAPVPSTVQEKVVSETKSMHGELA